MQNDKEKLKIELKKRLYSFVLKLIKFLSQQEKNIISKVIIEQLMQSRTSVLANYVEGQSASSKRDFIKYFEISLKSINESKVWLALLRDAQIADKNEIEWFLIELEEFGNIFGASILTLKGKR